MRQLKKILKIISPLHLAYFHWESTPWFLLITFLLINCSRYPEDVRWALQYAGNNKKELVAVLDHYKNTGDSMKLKAAYFLISNMPFHYSYKGEGFEIHEEAYRVMAGKPKGKRIDEFDKFRPLIHGREFSRVFDIQVITAEYLIESIDLAFDTWINTPWAPGVDFELFCNFVLPYRVQDERLTRWRKLIHGKNHDLLHTNWFEGGEKYEAEDAFIYNGIIDDVPMASNDKTVRIGREENAFIEFEIEIFMPGDKLLYIHYINGGERASHRMIINGKETDTVIYKPTDTWATFGRPVRLFITLEKGLNNIRLIGNENEAKIDYIRLSTVENSFFFIDDGITSGAEYILKNKHHNKYLIFKPTDPGGNKTVYLSNLQDFESSGLQVNYIDFGFYSITSKFKDTLDICNILTDCSFENTVKLNWWEPPGESDKKWAIIPVENGYYKIMSKLNGKCIDASDSSHNGKVNVYANQYNGTETQLWKFEKLNDPVINFQDDLVKKSIMDAVHRVKNKRGYFEFFRFNGLASTNALDLYKYNTGNCGQCAHYYLYLMRSIGIPSAIDFTPQYANHRTGHDWNVVFNEAGKAIDLFHQFPLYKRPKVFRRTYAINRKILALLNETGGEVPDLFKDVHCVDVTAEKYITANVEIDFSLPHNANNGYAYLCVFNNKTWIPVHWARINEDKSIFTDMGCDIVYITSFYTSSGMVTVGSPFLLKEDGETVFFKADPDRPQTMVLHRKYPYFMQNELFNHRMIGGRFQGSDCPEFSTYNDLYVFNEVTEARWYKVTTEDDRSYRFLRYIGPDGGYCNINELKFFDNKGNEHTGKVIGTSGSFQDKGSAIEKVFDNDILTGFYAPTPDGGWVGLELDSPAAVGSIRFMPRNDGNCIETGDTYELVYWDNGWKSAGNKVARSDSLIFENVPAGGLYLLKNHTKGVEERIFTYEDGKQVWW